MKPSERPILDLPYSSQDLALEVAAVGGILLNLGLFGLFWPRLPAVVPTHFGVSGRPDAWGDKSTILILPAASLILYFMLTIVSRYPHKFNYLWPITAQNAAVQYRLARSLLLWLKVEIIALFGFLEWTTIWTALKQGEGLGLIFLPAVLGLIFGTLGVYFYFAYRNR